MNIMLSSALGLISGPLKNIIDQLAGEKNELWVEILKLMSRMTPEKILDALKGAPSKIWKIWKKIPVGGHTLDELLEKFKTATYKVGSGRIQASDFAWDILRESKYVFTSEVEEDVEFVMGRLEDLFGFKEKKDIVIGDFLDEAFLAKHDLEFCKPIDAFYLRLSYNDQPLDEWIHVGIKPISAFSRIDSILRLIHNQRGMRLHSDEAIPNFLCGRNCLWVFRLRKITQA